MRRRGELLELSDLSRGFGSLSLHADASAAKAVEQLAEFEARGLRLRPRALMTTMFARLFLGDLFFHGIGGAKYDQLTDVIVHRFLGCVPPAFLVLTATAKLRGGKDLALDDDLRRINERLRGLHYNPQRWATLTEDSRPLIAEKQQWLACEPPLRERRTRHQALRALNDGLQPFVAAERASLLEERQRWLQLRNQDRVLGSREYAFCLHSTEVLRTFLLDI